MWIVNLALRRPYTFIVLAIFILISGGRAILQTPKDIFPSINIPEIYAHSEVQAIFERAADACVARPILATAFA